MDIKSTEKRIYKLLQEIQEVESKKPNLYKKSKDRIKNIADISIQIFHVASNILKESQLEEDEFEFADSSNEAIKEAIRSIEVDLNDLKSFMGTEDSNVRLDPIECKKIFKQYRNVIEYTSNSTIGCSVVDDCSKLIWRWYSTRFLKYNKNFKYNVKNLKKWLFSIVILYGKYHENGDITSFNDTFDSWISDVISGSNNYAVPYEVNSVSSNFDPSYFTLSSIVIWDILVDSGYSKLCRDHSNVYPSEDSLFELYADNSPSSLNNYRNYQFDRSIIDECRLDETNLDNGDSYEV